jgi:4a-hydroxytetrahydrobiopterin dehydratase
MKLSEQECTVPKGVGSLLAVREAVELSRQIPKWTLEDRAVLRDFVFRSFREAIDFVNKVAGLAEAQNHHPDISIYYNRVRLSFSTHKIGGLSCNDFIMAAKIDELSG